MEKRKLKAPPKDSVLRLVLTAMFAAICFVVQMERARYFAPNDRTHPAFGQALRAASEAGVDISARLCRVTPDSLSLGAEIPVVLSPRRGRSSM